MITVIIEARIKHSDIPTDVFVVLFNSIIVLKSIISLRIVDVNITIVKI